MADLSLSAGGGSQTAAQSPQSLVNSGTQTESSSKVQPGTATSVVSPSAISLNNSNLTLTNLAGSPQTTTAKSSVATVSPIAPTKHHVNGVLLGVCIALFIIAAVSFFFVSKTEKNTTNYY